MKTKLLLHGALLGMFFSPLAFAKEKLDLSAFRGSYRGNLNLAFSGVVFRGSAAVFFTVPENGKSASITQNLLISDGLVTLPLTSVLTLSRNKTTFASDVKLGLPGLPSPGTGTWSQGKRLLHFSATNIPEGITLTGTGKVRDLRNNRKLTLTVDLSVGGVSQAVFTTDLRARLPRNLRRNSRR